MGNSQDWLYVLNLSQDIEVTAVYHNTFQDQGKTPVEFPLENILELVSWTMENAQNSLRPLSTPNQAGGGCFA